MARYALTIFLSAFLLFLVQPLIGKYILPWFGGTPAVWTTCMLFFQVLLLGGYAYAHLLADRVAPRVQGSIHLALLGLSLLFLPIAPKEFLKPTGSESPQFQILLLLLVTIGAPYLMLSSTGPLLQSWFSRTHAGRSPYRLYSLSNVGSLLALLCYPFLVEPYVRLWHQAMAWSIGFALFVLLCGWCAIQVRRKADGFDLDLPGPAKEPAAGEPPASRSHPPAVPSHRPTFSDITLWLLLSMAGSVMLLAVTNMISQEIAVVPFLWILPLALYLLSFIICFDSPRWYLRWLFVPLLGIAIAVWCLTLGHQALTEIVMWTGWFKISPLPGLEDKAGELIDNACKVVFSGGTPFPWIRQNLGTSVDQPTLWGATAVHLSLLFACVMACHGELARSKPQPRHLTLYFLMVSIGGAMGGVFVALIAPYIFPWFWEYQLGLLATWGAVLWAVIREERSPAHWGWSVARWSVLAPACLLLIPLAGVLSIDLKIHDKDAKFVKRNFYGVLRVTQEDDPTFGAKHVLTHGTITHGYQFLDDEMSRQPTSYYARDTGIFIAAKFHPRRFDADPQNRGLRIGVVGLGTGSIAALGQTGDYFRFYEINPAVLRLSDDWFTYVKDTPAKVEVVLGDARVQMEREVLARQPQQFDVLALDAFSSDSIPMHLLTRECADTYWKHLKPDGILALHISNRYVELRGVCHGLADIFQKKMIVVDSDDDEEIAQSGSTWVLLTSNRQFIDNPPRKDATLYYEEDPPEAPGVLTSRPDEDTGTATVAPDHGVKVADVVDVSWTGGSRNGMHVTATTDTTISLDGGYWDDLPSATTAVEIEGRGQRTLFWNDDFASLWQVLEP
ncbi:MAG: fused MFS/spermidine synthase [Planctomycetes bacterium]|nr:fused MFS/spermidine synthase [Planctomycetota bacterium]